MESATGPSSKAAWKKARAPNQAKFTKCTSLLMPVLTYNTAKRELPVGIAWRFGYCQSVGELCRIDYHRSGGKSCCYEIVGISGWCRDLPYRVLH
jgi:hypothetical protein